MTRDQFTDFLRDPPSIANFAGDELQQLVADFPYCQPLRVLQLKQLKLNNSIQYSSRLKETAAYSPDRVKLYQVMNSKNKTTSPVGISAFPDLVENTIDQNPIIEEVATDPTSLSEQTPTGELAKANTEIEEIVNQAQTIESDNTNTVEPAEVNPQEIIVNRLKELDLWVEKVEEQEEEKANVSETASTIESSLETMEIDAEPSIIQENNEQESVFEETRLTEESEVEIPLEINEQVDHNTLVSGYLESITQSNEMISASTNGSPQQASEQDETPVLSFTEWLKRKDFPHEGRKEDVSSTTEFKSTTKEEAPVVAKLLYLKEVVHEPSAPALESPTVTKAEEIKTENTEPPIASVSDEPAPINQPVRTLRTNEELGLKEVIRPIKKGRAAERKNKNKAEEKSNNQKPNVNPEHQSNIIDRFIQEEPRITPIRATIYNPVNMARRSTIQPDDVVTETLAMIYAQQGNFEKAITFYEKLSLKFPEKSVYFASLIQELKNKQNQ